MRLFFALCLCIALIGVANAQNVKLESEIRSLGDPPKTIGRSTTYFTDNAVYDCIEPNGEIILYEPQTGMIQLLSPTYRVRMKLAASDMKAGVQKLQEAVDQPADFASFLLKPSFDVQAGTQGDEMLFRSKWLDYQVETQPLEPSLLATRYFEFSEVCCYLSVAIAGSPKTTLARLEVNRSLQAANRFPAKLKISLYPKGKSNLRAGEQVTGCIARWNLRLDDKDERRLLQIQEQAKTFPLVSFSEYQKTVRETK